MKHFKLMLYVFFPKNTFSKINFVMVRKFSKKKTKKKKKNVTWKSDKTWFFSHIKDSKTQRLI